MSSRKPKHADAELILKLYDLRREPVMRESRKTIAQWTPKSFSDIQAVVEQSHPANTAWRQVSSYFEMAFGFARHGIVPADFLAENAGEGLLLYAKIEPYLADFRREISPTGFRNAEWLVKKSASAAERMKLFRKRLGLAAPVKEKPKDKEKDKEKGKDMDKVREPQERLEFAKAGKPK
jgi:hypothetical protein